MLAPPRLPTPPRTPPPSSSSTHPSYQDENERLREDLEALVFETAEKVAALQQELAAAKRAAQRLREDKERADRRLATEESRAARAEAQLARLSAHLVTSAGSPGGGGEDVGGSAGPTASPAASAGQRSSSSSQHPGWSAPRGGAGGETYVSPGGSVVRPPPRDKFSASRPVRRNFDML